MAGVTVEVMSGERAIASGVTDMGGGITLEGVRPGAHALRVTLPTVMYLPLRERRLSRETAASAERMTTWL